MWEATLVVRFITVVAAIVSADAQTNPLSIRVVEGDHAINSIKLRQGHDPVVQVTDSGGEPVAGASVTFLLPASGAGATFSDSALSATVQTDRRGIATVHGLRPNRLEGQFRIRVIASWHGESVNASLQQTNAEPLPKSNNSKWILIAVLAGGAVAGGAVAASHGGGGTSTGVEAPSTTPTTGTIVPGTPSFGPPR